MRDGTIESTISSFAGRTGGYDLSARGRFTYTPVPKGAGGVLGSVFLDLTGGVRQRDVELVIKRLRFTCTDPLPTNVPYLGDLTLSFPAVDGETLLNATLALESGRVKAEGRLNVNGVDQPETLRLEPGPVGDLVPAGGLN